MGRWRYWREVPISPEIVEVFRMRGELSHMRVHVAGTTGLNIAAMTDAEVIQYWWWMIQRVDTAQMDKWDLTPEEWLIRKGWWTPAPVDVALPPAPGDGGEVGALVDRALRWASANPGPAAGIAVVTYLAFFGGKRRRGWL